MASSAERVHTPGFTQTCTEKAARALCASLQLSPRRSFVQTVWGETRPFPVCSQPLLFCWEKLVVGRLKKPNPLELQWAAREERKSELEQDTSDVS